MDHDRTGAALIKKYGDIISSAVLLLFTGIYYGATFELNIRNAAGNALVPRLTSYILGACLLFILIKSILKLVADKKRENAARADGIAETTSCAPQSEAGADEDVKSDYAKVVLTLVLIAAYALLFPLLGFPVATPLYLCAQILLLMPKGKRRFIPPLVLSVAFTAAIYFIFTTIFLLVLPTGTLW